MTKSLIFILLFASLCAFSKTKPLVFRNECNTSTQDTIPEIVVQISKSERYKIYLKDCNEVIMDTILQTGYIKFDTIRVSSIPSNNMYSGKTIIKSLKISKDITNIIVADTVWNELGTPEYRSSWNYYVLANHPIPASSKKSPEYSHKIIVSRPKVYAWKKSKPLDFNEWTKYIYSKPTRTKTKEQYF
ncbi:MAG: hypothetical protein WC384_06215 [Prolixibacteraceae bacterium]|jgi:hypothetical protein